jgi:hypothetical protein
MLAGFSLATIMSDAGEHFIEFIDGGICRRMLFLVQSMAVVARLGMIRGNVNLLND